MSQSVMDNAFAAVFLMASLTARLGQNIVRHSCGIEAQFYKIASDNAMSDALSYTFDTVNGIHGCIDACVGNASCRAFNAKKMPGSSRTCELLRYDRTTHPKAIVARNGWDYYDTGLYSSAVGHKCKSLTYNPCYPCQCIDSCFNSSGYSCNCTSEMPTLPEIYLPFESTVPGNSQEFAYDRGQDMNGRSIAKMSNGANIGQSAGRPGKVLRISGINAGVDVGYFADHIINNPLSSRFTISVWMKILSPYAGEQVIIATGRLGYYTGVLLKVGASGTKLTVRVITRTYHYSGVVNIHDTLKTWTHVVMVHKYDRAEVLRLYINGKKRAAFKVKYSTSTSTRSFSRLNFGAGGIVSFKNENWNIHLDDFAYWNYDLTFNEISFVQNKGYV